MPKVDRDAIKALAKQHNIALYSAKMILKEKWTLDYALSLEKPVWNQGVRWLLSSKKKKFIMAFRTFDKGTAVGKVLKVRKYNNLILSRGRLKYLEKIDTAYIYNSRIHRLLPDYIKRDPFISDAKGKPAYKPSDRKPIDLAALKEQTAVRLTLYTGEIMEGIIAWITDYDFEIRLDRYLSVMVFKHAVCDAVEKEYHRFTQPIRKRPERKPFQKDRPPQRGTFHRPPTSGGGGGGFGPTGFGPH
jgi:sRNA-binding regulator protein Hfq